jgi:menaquinol-cytochrome c reductase iron-sulfur subunit
MPKSPHMSRNEFVRVVVAFLGTVIGAVVGLPAIGYILSPAWKAQKSESKVSLGPLTNYPLGVPTLFSFTRTKVNGWEKTVNSYGVYVLRKSETDVAVLSNKCTHLSCRVTWKDDLKEYVCPCHDGHFDVNGNVVFGPPPRPLDHYTASIENDNITIQFQEG